MVNVSFTQEELFWLEAAMGKFIHAPHYKEGPYQRMFKKILAKIAKYRT